jgi:Flp pilus assembly protein TadG
MRLFARDERGQALVEFAFILPVLLLLILGLIDIARAVQEENTLAFAAREGTRYAIVHGATCGATTGCTGLTWCGERIYTNTTVAAGSRTVTVTYDSGTAAPSTAWNQSSAFAAGTRILADSGGSASNQEQITVSSVTGTTLTATFTKAHSGIWQITAGCSDSTMAGIVESAAIGVPNVTTIVGYPDGGTQRGQRVWVDAYAPFVPLPSQYLLNGALTITLRGGSMLVIQN